MTPILEPQALNEVQKFHELFDAYIGNHPQIPPIQIAHLRIKLLEEELQELKKAVQENNLIEAADALTDLQYVLSGAILAFGLHNVFKDLFDEVHKSNMSKASEKIEDAQATISYYKEKRNVEGKIVEKDGKFIVYREPDEKILKSIKYYSPNLGEKINASLVK